MQINNNCFNRNIYANLNQQVMFEIATGLRAFNRYKNYKYLVNI